MLGKRLESLRNGRDMSQAEVAKALNLTQQAIDNYEKGSREPKGTILVRLATFYNVTTDYLHGMTDDPRGQAETTAHAVPSNGDELVVMFRGKKARLTPKELRTIKAWIEEEDEAGATGKAPL